MTAIKRRGRPSHEPTEEIGRQVEMLSGIGVPIKQIGLVVGLDDKTISKHYRGAMDRGQAKATSKVANRLFDIATGDSRDALTACIFWLKCRAAWKPPAETEINVGVDCSNKTALIHLPPEQDKALANMIAETRERVRMP